MKNYIISEQLVNAVLAYLGEQKFKEVAPLINELVRVQPLEDKKEDIKPIE
jgi:hypothetical protein